MNNLIKYIQKHKNRVAFLILISLLIIIIGIPLLINCLFKYSIPCKFFNAEWSAGDALAYYGEILSFLGTTILSALALWQNHVIEEKSNKHTAILELMEKEKNLPYLIIEKISGFKNNQDLTLNIKNESENIALNVIVSEFSIVDKQGNTMWEKNTKYSASYLNSSTPLEIRLANPEIKDASDRIIFTITYYDKFNDKHERNAIGEFTGKNGNMHFKIV